MLYRKSYLFCYNYICLYNKYGKTMGKKISIIIIFSFLLITVVNSGCIKDTTANSTWGEKKISLNTLKVANNTTAGNYAYEGTNYYYVEGWIYNNNQVDALNVEMTATFYAADGSVVATNNTVFLDPKNIPPQGVSYFLLETADPNKVIVNYKIEIINAKGEYS